jgi:hypothetical protein
MIQHKERLIKHLSFGRARFFGTATAFIILCSTLEWVKVYESPLSRFESFM